MHFHFSLGRIDRLKKQCIANAKCYASDGQLMPSRELPTGNIDEINMQHIASIVKRHPRHYLARRDIYNSVERFTSRGIALHDPSYDSLMAQCNCLMPTSRRKPILMPE